AERRRDELLRRDIVDEKPHPLVEGLARRQRSEQASRRAGQMHDLSTVDRLDNRVAGRKMSVERPDPDAGSPGDLFEADIRADFAERGLRRLDQTLAVA